MQQDRFKDAPWFEKAKTIKCIVGGAGGIGSWVTFFLARIGYAIQVYDFDIVEEHNLGGQLFMHNAVGKYKVDALLDSISKFNFYSNPIYVYNAKIQDYNPSTAVYYDHVFISCFDNMSARQAMFNKYIQFMNNYPNKKTVFIDGRLLMEQMDIFFLDSEERNRRYASEQLFDDSEVEELPCSMKQTSHSAAMIASHMVGMITNHTSNLSFGDDILNNPYHWQFVIPTQHTTYDQ